jgi:ribosomal protein S18 acetylase RimI-like enzyme
MLDLFVLPRWRSRGIGRALVTAVAREALRRRLTCLGWGVRGSNTRAKRFYRRLGATIGDARVASLSGRALVTLAGLPGRFALGLPRGSLTSTLKPPIVRA